MRARSTIALLILTSACIDRGGGVPMAPDEPVVAASEGQGLLSDSVAFGSGAADSVVSCTGPACGSGPFPRGAAVVQKHEYYAEPFAGSAYIAPVADGTTIAPPGYKCCTTAVFVHAFALPADAVSATLVVDVLADNQARLTINGNLFGIQPPSDMLNFMGPAHSFTTTFVPDSSGRNRLTITFVDEGGALGLNYRARITYARAAKD